MIRTGFVRLFFLLAALSVTSMSAQTVVISPAGGGTALPHTTSLLKGDGSGGALPAVLCTDYIALSGCSGNFSITGYVQAADGTVAGQLAGFDQLPTAITAVTHKVLVSYSGGSAGTFTATQLAAGDISGLSTVAASGSYADLLNKPTSLAPSGTASGDLGGSYPSPTVVQINGAVIPTSATIVGTNASKQLVSVNGTTVVSLIGSNVYDPFGAASTALSSAEAYSANASNLASGTVAVARLPTIPYTQLSGTPTIPTNNNQLTNGAGYITSSTIGAASGTSLSLTQGLTIGAGYGIAIGSANGLLFGTSGTAGDFVFSNPGVSGMDGIMLGSNTTSAPCLKVSGTTVSFVQAGTTTCSSTYTNIAFGTVTSGTWNGTAIGIAYGGTATNTAPSSAQVLIAQSSTAYAPETIGGDCTISSSGSLTCTKTNGTLFGTLATLSAAPANTLSGTTLNSTIVTSSLQTVGTIGTGVWQGTAIGIAYGGTGAATAAANSVFGNFTASLAAPSFSTAPIFSAANLTNFPTFNQSTTGNAATATTATNQSGGTVSATTLSASSTVSGAGFTAYLGTAVTIGSSATPSPNIYVNTVTTPSGNNMILNAANSSAAIDFEVGGVIQGYFVNGGLNMNSNAILGISTITSAKYATTSNCSNTASPAVCSSAAAGGVIVAVAATTEVVNTTAVTANSIIQLTFDSSLSTRLGVTCNTAPSTLSISARSPGTSFTISTTAPTTNPDCVSYTIIN